MNFSRLRIGPIVAVALFAAALAALLIGGWLAYRPGLSGNFLFDDFGNLPAIGATGPIDHWATFWRYITSGSADPLGRPLTLLSFLLDAQNWPALPRAFKYTNVMLHLLNGALLCWVLLRLGRALKLPEAQTRFAALAGMGAWLLHPLLVSTTLYVVQREAMLPATFTLVGMLGWIGAREALARGHVRRGWAGLLLSGWGCTLLAALSKANGALLPLLLLATDWIALQRTMPLQDRPRRIAVRALLIAPTLLLLGWMLVQIPMMRGNAAEFRDFTLGQRMLTEPRALADYLRLLFLPQAQSSGLFNDAFPASNGWLHPVSALPCMALVVALIALAIAVRKRHPAIALALLFYFAGQLLESTWIPLELYYEHRNYLPSMLLFWPIGIALGAPGALRWLRGLCATGALLFLASLTLQRASLWGDAYQQALIWAAINPDSARAQTHAAQYDLAHGAPRLAAARLRNALPTHPHDLQIALGLLDAECDLHGAQPQTLAQARNALTTARTGGTLAYQWLSGAMELAQSHSCAGLDFAVVQSLLDAARENAHWRSVRGRQQDIAHLQGLLDLAQAMPERALGQFDRALALAPRADTALEQASILGMQGFPRLGLLHLDYWNALATPAHSGISMSHVHAWVLQRQRYWQNETARLRATLKADVANPTHTASTRARQ